jgi:heat shock protein HslJ/uncharacterized lipoprotein YbaY
MKTIGIIGALVIVALVVMLWLRPSEAPAPTVGSVTVFGTATYLQRIALPPGAVLKVRIEDVSVADRVAPTVAEVSEPFGDRQVPIPFTLSVPRSAIDTNARYALRATISVGDQLRFTTDRDIPVLTQGALDEFDLLLAQASAPSSPTSQGEAIPGAARWRGEFLYMADAANFTDCASGQRWPVAKEGDYLATERAYVEQRSAPGAPLVVTFDGRLGMRPPMEGPDREHIVIDRFAAFEAGSSCGSASTALRDTEWRLVELDGQSVAAAEPQQRVMGLTLASEGSQVSGYSGCNNLAGGYESSGDALRFTGMIGTMMACDPAVMERERTFHQMLGQTTAYRIEGRRLTLLAGQQPVAQFEAAAP